MGKVCFGTCAFGHSVFLFWTLCCWSTVGENGICLFRDLFTLALRFLILHTVFSADCRGERDSVSGLANFGIAYYDFPIVAENGLRLLRDLSILA